MPDTSAALNQLGVAISGGLIFAFIGLLVILVVHRASSPLVSAASGVLRHVDSLLVRRVSQWLGLGEVGAVRRWSRLVGGFSLFCLLGALTPVPLALPALVIGFVFIIAVFRRWSWDEEDRALGLAEHQKRMPGSEDFNDELLVALGSIFTFGSLLIWRLSELQIFDDGEARGLVASLLYIASEALEALPIVGNIQVLGYHNPSGVEVVQPRGGWVAFALRMLLDILVIGGLLKAAAIAGRVASGLDLRRQENALREARTEEETAKALDALSNLARRGNPRAVKLLESVALPPPDDPDTQPETRRAAADRLMTLSGEGAVIGVGGLSAAQMAYDVLLTPELKKTSPRTYLRCQMSRAQALYMLGMQMGSERGSAHLVEAQQAFQDASRSLQILGDARSADQAELGYWAAQSQWMSVNSASLSDLAGLAGGIHDFVGRLEADGRADADIVQDARRLLNNVNMMRAVAGDQGAVNQAADVDGNFDTQALLDKAAVLGAMTSRDPSAGNIAALRDVMGRLERLHSAEGHVSKANRITAALRLAQSWRTLVTKTNRADAVEQALSWCAEARSLADKDAPRIVSAIQAIEAYCLSAKAALQPPGEAREVTIKRSLDTFRHVIHDPAMAGDALLDETRANMVVALIGAADNGAVDLAEVRLREAVDVSDALVEDGRLENASLAAQLLNSVNARQMLAAYRPAAEQAGLLTASVRDAKRAIDLFQSVAHRNGQGLALKALGHGHMRLCNLAGPTLAAVEHGRLAHAANKGALELLDSENQSGLRFAIEREDAALMIFLARADNDRSLIEAAVTRLEALHRVARDGPLAAQIPFIEQDRARALAMLKDWNG